MAMQHARHALPGTPRPRAPGAQAPLARPRLPIQIFPVINAASSRSWSAPAVIIRGRLDSSSSSSIHPTARRHVCRAAPLLPESIPDDVTVALDDAPDANQSTYDAESKTIRVPLSALAPGARRTKMVMFTCNQCGGRSARLVNPLAWEKGAVFCQCQHCNVWHTLAAHPSIIEEVRYSEPSYGQQQQQQQSATATAGSREDEHTAGFGNSSSTASSGTALLEAWESSSDAEGNSSAGVGDGATGSSGPTPTP